MQEPKTVDRSALTEAERIGRQRADEFLRVGAAYARMQATRPSTLGFALSSNPLSLLAWCVATGPGRRLGTSLIFIHLKGRREATRLERSGPTHRHIPYPHLPVVVHRVHLDLLLPLPTSEASLP
jgi:hypothetical protein